MRTYSHAILTAALGTALRDRGVRVDLPRFLLGSFIPDVPFLLLSLSGAAYLHWGRGVSGDPMWAILGWLYQYDPLWIAAHNLFHAPLMIGLYLVLAHWAERQGYAWGFAVRWFALGCLLHTALDIPTHRSDGPVLFFPLNWTYRFPSPISYWERDYHAAAFTLFEYSLNALAIAYLAWRWVRRKLREAAALRTH